MSFLDYSIPCGDELLRFQEFVFRAIYDVDSKNVQQGFQYDFVNYFNSIAAGEESMLRKKTILVNYEIANNLLLRPKKIYVSES